MSAIPYVVRRGGQLYLRVRIPADLAAKYGKDFFIKSLKTGDTRQARAEAAQLLADLHTMWNEARVSDTDDDALTEQKRALLQLSAFSGTATSLQIAARHSRLKSINATLETRAKAKRVADQLAEKQADAEDRATLRALLREYRQHGALPVIANHPSVIATAAPASAPEGLRPWSEFIDQFFDDRPSIGESAKTSHRQAFRELENRIGTKPAIEVTKTDLKDFATWLRDKPINRAGRTQMSQATIVKHLSHLKGFFEFLFEKGYIATNPATGVKARTRTKAERQEIPRRAMTNEELKNLFLSPLFTGCASRSRRSVRGTNVYRDEPYWFCIIMLMTGARVEEIAGMPAKLVDIGGTLCFDLTGSTKTSAGRRHVPVLPDLLKLGLIEWAEEQERRGRGMVEGPNSHADWSKWLNRYFVL